MSNERQADEGVSSITMERSSLSDDICEELGVIVLRRSEDDVHDAAQIEIPGKGDDPGLPATVPPPDDDEEKSQAKVTI